jgi:phenylalanyl-tRNA synthetase beta chain
VVVGQVVRCEKHPDADKLNVTQVDIGSQEKLQIVCGAKNVAAGQFVAVATVGAVLGDDFTIKEAKLRGVESYGMICSTSEIGLPNMGDGIVVLDESIGDLKLGEELSNYPLLNDTVIDIELTANRGDCLSIYGVARDLGAYYKKRLAHFTEDEYDNSSITAVGRLLRVDLDKNEQSSLSYKVISADSVKESLLVDLRLAFIGLSGSGMYDKVTKYAMHATGVILRHYAYDFFLKGEMAELKVIVNEQGYDAVSSESAQVSLVGVSQAEESKAKTSDSMAILEASYVHPEIISEKVNLSDIATDEIYYKSSRGSDPRLRFGLWYFSKIAHTYYGLNIHPGMQQIKDYEVTKQAIVFEFDKMDQFIGQRLDRTVVMDILRHLKFDVEVIDTDEKIALKVPFFRHDIKNFQDVCEEIVRIVGIDNIESKPLAFYEKEKINRTYEEYKQANRIRLKAAGVGYVEHLSFVFNQKSRLQAYGFDTLVEAKALSNPITNELDTLRTTMMLSLLEAAALNAKRGLSNVRLFEIGKVVNKNRAEFQKLAFVHSGTKENDSIGNSGKSEPIDFFAFASSITQVVGEFEVRKAKAPTLFYNPYEYGELYIRGVLAGVIAKVHTKVCDEYALGSTYVCEIDFSKIDFRRKVFEHYSKFPQNRRDVSFLIPQSMQYGEIKNILKPIHQGELKEFYAIDEYESEELGAHKSLTIRFIIGSNEKTLNDEEINATLQQVIETLKESKIEIR